MVLSLTPVAALAAEGDAESSITGVSVSYGTQTWETDSSGNLAVTVSNDSDVTDFDVEVTLATGAAFTPTGHTTGDLYVESATDSAAQTMAVNRDAAESTLLLLAPGTTVYTVNYVVDGQTITWLLPAGADLETPYVELSDGESIAWYTDAGFNNALADDATVTGNTTLYGNITGGTTGSGEFYTDLINGNTATITNSDDWEIFVEYADQADAGQLIILGTDIDCENATYDSLTFAGSFNGNGKTISNAEFRAVSTSSGDTCSGMFAKIGPGQVVANLTLQNVTAQYSGTYAGVLAGMVDGAGGSRTLVQNVQVRDSSASGRSAGGVAGFIRNADVRYCSSRDTRVTGVANGGGVVGLSNTVVQFCYSTSTPTALRSLLGGCAGGVVGKNVRGAYTEYCWATMKVVGGGGENPGTDVGDFEVDPDNTTIEDYEAKGYNQNGNEYWILDYGDATDFDPEAVEYTFASNS